jgi:hypothetical protein
MRIRASRRQASERAAEVGERLARAPVAQTPRGARGKRQRVIRVARVAADGRELGLHVRRHEAVVVERDGDERRDRSERRGADVQVRRVERTADHVARTFEIATCEKIDRAYRGAVCA